MDTNLSCSFGVIRPEPSAMLEGMEITALLIWLDKANNSSFG